MIDASGDEYVWANGQLVQVDSGSKDKYYTVTVEATDFGSGVSDALKAAAIGTHTGSVECDNERFVLHATTAELTGTAWLTPTDVELTVTIAYDSSEGEYTIEGSTTFFVTVNGEDGSNNEDFTISNSTKVNNSIEGTLSVSFN